MPERIARLPRNKAGYPVPWFVAVIGGQPDFRVIGPGKLDEAVRRPLCWVCGCGFACGEDRAFVIGPMCAVNRVTAEPPCHLECAAWSAANCPFLTTPHMTRRDRHLPGQVQDPAGIMIRRNPGVALVWVTGIHGWRLEKQPDGLLFRLRDPLRTLWFAQGREATRAEVRASIRSGLPLLRAEAERDGPEAVLELRQMTVDAMRLMPA
jgi:hypothetical protein